MESLIGKTLKNRYRIDEALGRGGMAEVFKAYDQKRAGFVAIKLLREDLSRDKVFLRRFEREAKTLAKLQHRNIVRFYGMERDGLDVFIVMDFIEGEALRDVIFNSKETMTVDRMIALVEPVCSALHYAHEMGIVHCDIKPANIMLAKNGEVMVSDFGIARSMDAATSTMVGVGTPAYMAPELIKGEDPTPQSDIYSLGITVYEMVTGGERPFTGDRAGITGTTAEKVRWEHLNGKVVSPRKHNKLIPKHVEAAIIRCLEKEPADRFTTVQDFFYALTHEPVEKPTKKTAPTEKIEEQKSKAEEQHIKEEEKDENSADQENDAWLKKAGARINKEWNLMTKQARIVVITVMAVLLISNIVFAVLAFKKDPSPQSEAAVIAATEPVLPTNTPVPTSTPLPVPVCELTDADVLVSGWQENYCASFSYENEVDGWATNGEINERVAKVNLENYKNMLNVRAEMFQELNTYVQSPAVDLRDFMVTVEGRLSSYAGHPYHEWGLALKANGNSYYYFSIDSKNNYYFNMIRDGKQSSILDGRFSSDINPIDEVNRLTVVVDGYQYKLYINGVLQDTIKDNRILKGATGLYLSMGESTTLDWEFDNFVIYAPVD